MVGFRVQLLSLAGTYSDLKFGRSPRIAQRSQDFRWTPHPVLGAVREDGDCMRVFFIDLFCTITGWGTH